MCGFVGVFDTSQPSKVNPGLLRRMNDSLIHRGPDGYGYHLAPGIGLGHRRLAIIDLKSGDQPIYNEDRTVAVVFNGEIYNYIALRRELETAGHVFATESDTEVLVHGWEEWGQEVVRRLWGMFAFAIWDGREQILMLARDRLGKKPIYYAYLANGQLVFASELKALLCHPDLPRKISTEVLADYFTFGYVPDPKTIFENVFKLEPAHLLVQSRHGPATIEAYWRPSGAQAGGFDEREACEELMALLADSVKIRLQADVPLGAFLSGGVDSSGVVSQMVGGSPEPVKTFTIAVDDPRFDESRYAREVADLYDTDHRTKTVTPDAFDLVDRFTNLFDEPFADSSALPTLLVSEFTRQHVKVALSGDGGDEVFAGYRRYKWHLMEESLRGLMPQALRGPIFGGLARCYPKLDWAPRPLRAKTTFQELSLSSLDGYLNNVAIMSEHHRDRLFSPAFRRNLQGYTSRTVLSRHLEAADSEDALFQAQYVDLKTYLPGDILVKVDRTSMAHSLEVRAPLLDHRLVEWGLRLPRSAKIRGAQGKWILKRALEPRLPHDILYRPKQGFSVPIAAWFRGKLRQRVETLILGEALADCGFFDRDQLRALLDAHLSGRRNHDTVLWALVVFAQFLESASGARTERAAITCPVN